MRPSENGSRGRRHKYPTLFLPSTVVLDEMFGLIKGELGRRLGVSRIIAQPQDWVR